MTTSNDARCGETRAVDKASPLNRLLARLRQRGPASRFITRFLDWAAR